MRKPNANSTSFWTFLLAVKHQWLTLVGGGLIMVIVLPLFERISGKNVPTWVYIAVLIAFALWACYLAWRDSQGGHSGDDAKAALRNHALAERLQTLLREAGEVDIASSNSDTSLGAVITGTHSLLRYSGQHTRVLNFLTAHYPDEVQRFEKDGNRILEELLNEVLTGKRTPGITYPKLEIEIEQTAFDFIDDHRIGSQYGILREPCYVTLFLKIKNPRPVSVIVNNFKLTLRVDGREYESFAESSVFNYRFVSLEGEELGEGSHSRNLNEQPVLLIDEQPREGSLQFIFEELRYIDLLTLKISLEYSPFTLLLTDSDRGHHPKEGTLTGEGNRYVHSFRRNTKKT